MANSSGGIIVDDAAWSEAALQALKDYRTEAAKQEHFRAEAVAQAARRYAPRAKSHDPREPVLADSITVVDGVDADGPYSEVGTSVPHGLYQEFGTSDMSAHPFMRPAIAENT